MPMSPWLASAGCRKNGNLVTDVTRLAHAGHHHAAGAVVEQPAGLDESGAEALLQRRDGGDFGLEDTSAARQQLVGIERGLPGAGLHARIIARRVDPQRRRALLS
jgi:hypothetical protein